MQSVTRTSLANPIARSRSENSLRSIIAVFAAIAVLLLAGFGLYQLRAIDPYVQDVLSRSGDTVRGHAIFQINCADCHGLEANGRVGPSLRGISDHKSRAGLIEQVISGKTPPMPQFQPSPQEMADLLSYLESL